MRVSVLGRLAPSPTGALHLGGAATFLIAWLSARSQGGRVLLRMEDLDPERSRPHFAEELRRDLRWLGLDWDDEVAQSSRLDRYSWALQELTRRGLTYECDCSRAELQRAASAPHPGEESRYPGLCRHKDRRLVPPRRPPALRARVPEDAVEEFVDRRSGPQRQAVALEAGDFLLRRGDGTPSYQLAVAVDDLELGVTEVVRGEDLLPSTARQRWLIRQLGGAPPSYLHTPLVVGPDGARLAKRLRGVSVADHRATGTSPELLVGALAHGLGLASHEEPTTPAALVSTFHVAHLIPGRVVLSGSLLEHFKQGPAPPTQETGASARSLP